MAASSWSKWCRRVSSRSGSIILLISPILCSLPMAVCNLLHAHVLLTSSKMKICIVQYTHGILISFLIFFYAVPILFSFFLHGKLIYFIRSKHHRHYVVYKNEKSVSLKRNTTTETQLIMTKKRSGQTESKLFKHQESLERNLINAQNVRRRSLGNIPGGGNKMATMLNNSTTAIAGHQGGKQNFSHSPLTSRTSAGTSSGTFYKINSQANANANRTVLLLVLLLSFYVLCWAPYNIYTWRHAYQSTINYPNPSLLNRTAFSKGNQTSFTMLFPHQFHSDLRRVIFINYALYLLSMISMCFSFIFYFSLNKQARREISRPFSCFCPHYEGVNVRKRHEAFQKPVPERVRAGPQKTRNQPYYIPNHQISSRIAQMNPRTKTAQFNRHPLMPVPNN